ncbi:MAG: hypothetical protein U0J08_08075 [Agathobaculum butyriciproducens]|jgi:hypothetical protein|nr:hypothetical protein [Agathobaculum butyriciproducens]
MVDEYISREAALADFESCNAENPNWTPQRVKTLLLRQPAADVAEVVRCRDCAKHYVVLGRDMCAKNASGLKDHLIGLSATLPDAFCSRGVRKDEGENDVSG